MRSVASPPRSLLILAARQGGLVDVHQCEAEGVGRDRLMRLVRNGRWERPTRGVYDPDPHRVLGHDERRERAAWLGMLAYGPEAIGVGVAAMAVHRLSGLPQRITPQVTLPGNRSTPARDGIRVRHFDHFTVSRCGARRVASVLDSLVQGLPDLDRTHAVAVLDLALNAGTITTEDVDVVRARLRGRRGAAKLVDWWPLVDGRSESILETSARLDCIDHGCPPDDIQRPIYGPDGRFVGRADLVWRLRNGRWLVVEIDGQEYHDTPEALFKDRHRQNAIIATGVADVLRFTAIDTYARDRIPAAVHAAIRADAARASRAARAEP